MGDEEGKKRVAIIGVASLFLVAMVIGVTIGVSKSEKGTGNNGDISATRKAVDAICQPTDYKDMCKSTLEKAAPNTDNPRDLAKAAFNAAVDEINNVTEHSPLLKELMKDPKTANATKVCRKLFGYAVEDFRRSMEEMGDFDLSNMDDIITNLKIWLSATITYEETCIDGFDEKNTTEAGLKVRKLLTTLMRMSSNGLAIVTGMQQVELGEDSSSSEDDDKQASGPKQRRLMSWSDDFVMGHDEFIDDDLLEEMARNTHKKRRLLESSHDFSVIGHEDVIPRWLDMDDRRRKLLEDKTLDELTPNVTVAQDGNGNYTKIIEAINQIPFKNKETFVILIKEGVYKEQVIIEKKQRNVVLIGDGPTKTIITGELSISDGTQTFDTCTVAARGDNFMAKGITFENTAGPEKHQAVAIRVQADKSIFYDCHFNGYQDTLYAHTYRQYYRDCQISGTVDFIFGDAAAFFQNCTFVVRKPLVNQQCIMLAQGRKERRQPTGIVLHKSKIVAAPDYFPLRFQMKSYLGRPWKQYSKSIIMESFIDDLIQPEGWMPWNISDFGLNTSYFGEYRNEGPGSNTNKRVKWGGIKTILPSRAESFMPPIFYEGDDWIKASGVPYIPALTSDSSTYIAPPGAVDEDPDNEPFASSSNSGDYDSPWAKKDAKSKKSKNKFSKDSGDKSDGSSKDSGDNSDGSSKETSDDSSEDSKDKSDDSSKETSEENSKDSGDKSDDSSKETSDESSKETSGNGSKGWTLESLFSPPPAMAPLSESWPPQDLSTIDQTPTGVDSISKAPTIWDLGVPSESPSIDSMPPSELLPSDDLSISSIAPVASMSEAPSQDLSGIPSSTAELEMTPTQINQDEISDGSLSENPSLTINNNRTVIQVSMDEVGEIPSSSPNEGPMEVTLDEPPTNKSPLSVINLEESLIEEEAPTNTPSESPSSYVNLERMLMQEEASTILESEGPSPIYNFENAPVQEEPTISVSPSSFVNIEKVLMQEESSTNLESESPSSMFNPKSAPMQEEPPISQVETLTNKTSKRKRMLMQEEPSTTLESESPSSMLNFENAPMQEDPPMSQEEASTYTTSESPSLMVNVERKLMQDVNLERMLLQVETPTTTQNESPSSMVNLEPNSMEEEPPTSTPSESPSLMFNLKRMLKQEESPTSAPSESPSLMINLERSLMQDVSLERMLMQAEPPTTLESESPSSMFNPESAPMQEEPPMSVSPSSSLVTLKGNTRKRKRPQSLTNFEKSSLQQEEASTSTTSENERMLMHEEPSTTLESESPSSMLNFENTPMQENPPMSQEEASSQTTSESPSLITNLDRKLMEDVNLEKMLMQEEPLTATPSESPSSSVVNLEPSLTEEEPPTSTPSESPSLMFNLKRMLKKKESLTSTPSESPSSSMINLEPNLMEDEPPTSTPSESPSLMSNLKRMLKQEESPTSTPSESPINLERILIQDVNLERMLMQEEPSTATPSESSSLPVVNLEPSSTKEEPPTSTPSESPSLMFNLKRMLKKEESLTSTPSESPSSSSMINLEPNSMEDEPPTSTPSESPSLMSNLKRMLKQEESPTSTPSESPINLERMLIQDVNLERMLMQEEPSTTTPSESSSLSVANLEPSSTEEEPPTSAPSASPSLMSNLKRMLKQEESPTSTPSESPVNLKRMLIQDVNLERMLMQEEPLTATPSESETVLVADLVRNSMKEEPPTSPLSESPSSTFNLKRMLKQEEPSTFSPSESPLLMVNFDQELMLEENSKPPSNESPSPMLKKMLIQEESPLSAPSESQDAFPSSEPSKSPSFLANLEKKLLETNDDDNDDNFDNASDDNDDHDKLVTSNTVRMDKVLESLHLKTREDLSLDEVMMQIPDPGPETSPQLTQSPRSIAMSPEIKKIGRNLLQSVSKKEGQANAAAANNDPNNHDAALAQLASSPQSKTFMAGNGGSMSGSPEAGEFLKQLGIDTTSLPNTPPAAKSDTSGEYKTGFRFSVIVAVMIIVLFV